MDGSHTEDTFVKQVERACKTLRYGFRSSFMAFLGASAKSFLPIFRCNSIVDHRVLSQLSIPILEERPKELLHMPLAVVPGIDLEDTVELEQRHHTQYFDHRSLVRTAVAVGTLLALDIHMVVVVAAAAAADHNPLADILQML